MKRIMLLFIFAVAFLASSLNLTISALSGLFVTSERFGETPLEYSRLIGTKHDDSEQSKIFPTLPSPPKNNITGPPAILPQKMLCNCSDTTTVCEQNCHRGILHVHKMGVMLLRKIAAKDILIPVDTFSIVAEKESGYSRGNNSKPDHLFKRKKFLRPFETGTEDYRHVVVTRKFYDAIVSGYLYHKAHMECELDWFGKPGHYGWLLNNSQENWELRIMNSTRQVRPWPAGRGRDLCTYLSDESEEDGMRVYVEWSKKLFLDPLVSFARSRREFEQTAGINRTIFVCYEQLLESFAPTVKLMAHWMFPAHKRASRVYSNRRPAKQAFGHATTTDPQIRDRLARIVGDIDSDLFHGSISWTDRTEFGCS